MNPGLLYLLRIGPRAKLRGIRRRMGPVKLAIVGVVIAGFVGMVVLANLASGQRGASAEQVARYGPSILLAFTVLVGFSNRGLYFRPAEVGFLFPAPLSRRELLLYHVVGRAGVAMLSAVWVALFARVASGNFLTQLVGYGLALLFLQFTQQVIAVLGAYVERRLGDAASRVALASFTLVPAAVFGLTAWSLPRMPLLDFLRALVEAEPVFWITLPARPFMELLAAESAYAFFVWLAVALGELGLMLWILLGLDVAMHETALQRSEQIQARLQRMKSGGAFAGGSGGRRWRVPRLPYLGGAGPVAWRQLTELVRSPKGVLSSFFFVFFVSGSVVAMPHLIAGGDGPPPRALGVIAICAVIGMSLLMTQHFAFDFRKDLDRMAALKAWPVTPFALTTGQLVSATVLPYLIMMSGVLLVTVALDDIPNVVAAGAALVLLPGSWAAAAVDNLIFLLLPYRMVTDDPGNLPFMGRLMLVMFLKGVLLGGLAFAAALLGIFTYHLTASLVAVSLVVLLALCAACLPLTWACAWAFSRFDVSTAESV